MDTNTENPEIEISETPDSETQNSTAQILATSEAQNPKTQETGIQHSETQNPASLTPKNTQDDAIAEGDGKKKKRVSFSDDNHPTYRPNSLSSRNSLDDLFANDNVISAGLSEMLEEETEDVEEWEFDVDFAKLVKLKDKIFFSLGIWNVVITGFLIGGYKHLFPYFYSVKYPIFIGVRYFQYKSRKWQYFMLDFCYYANVIVLSYLWIFPTSSRLFMIIFAICNGPLMWAIPLYRNSLVFHSSDRTTSLFIHITPTLTLYLIRWYNIPGYEVCAYDNCETSINDMMIIPTLIFILHMFWYGFVVFVWKQKILAGDADYLTSYRYLVGSKSGLVYNVINAMGEKYQVVLYVGGQILYCILTLTLTLTFFKYYWVHLTFMIIMTSWSFWNGANFYVEIFTRHAAKYAAYSKKTPISSTKSHKAD